MKNLKHLLSKSSPKTSNALVVTLLVLSFAGFLISGYLTAEHYLGGLPSCSIVSGCETVAKSEYSIIFGIPVALFGVLYFLAWIVLLVAYLDSKKEVLLKIALLLAIPGAGAALTLISIQAFILGAFCIYCVAVDIISLVIFVGMIKMFWYNKSN